MEGLKLNTGLNEQEQLGLPINPEPEGGTSASPWEARPYYADGVLLATTQQASGSFIQYS